MAKRISHNKDKKGWINSGSFKKGHKTNIGKNWKVSEKGRKAMSEGQKGKVSGFKGKKHSLISKIKNSLNNLGRNKSSKAHSWSKTNHPPSYKGGITPKIMKVRNSKRYNDWRTKVFKKDNYICQDCNKKGYLEAHHITPFCGLFGTENHNKIFDVDNGKTLCIDCHNDTKLGGKTK